MVELQSCASLVNQSSLCAIEEVKEETTARVIAEITAELQREREKNAELTERISALEAQIQKLDESSVSRQGSCLNATERSLEKLKRQKVGTSKNGTENGNATKEEIVSLINQDNQCIPSQNANAEDCLVSWMNMDETPLLHGKKLTEDDSAADGDDTDESVEKSEYEEADSKMDHDNRETNVRPIELKENHHEHSIERQTKPTFPYLNQIRNEDRKHDFMPPDPHLVAVQNHGKKEANDIEGNKKQTDDFASKEACHTEPGSSNRKPPKVAFCPKEVKRMLESKVLLSKNAQSHTIRKIIVFASLGIRHGCDDIYELDYNHFSIVRKGEPYVSSEEQGEHVLYENPGIRRKIFYPNWQNPTLCPVQILEEEKAMRPSDPSCPSCLFLCIKYGGRTRNLPQNEYVRQRMGRNKLKSFGPLMCRMAMLVHIRSGSFFFKALGITLLFMAGFPDELVQRETKYQNLDLLQKYYRTDEDAEGEELFLLHSKSCDIQARPGSDKLTGKVASSKSKGRKQANSTSKPCNLPKSASFQESAPPLQFGLMGYSFMQTQATAAFQPIPSLTPTDTPTVPSQMINSSAINVSYHNQTPYHKFPPQPASGFMPILHWPTPSAFSPSRFPNTYSYGPFPPAANCISIHHLPYYSQPSCGSLILKMAETNEKTDVSGKDSDVESDSSSSSAETKEALAS